MKHGPSCPTCATGLDEGPVVYRCSTCRRTVFAADLDNEFQPHTPTITAA